MRRVSVLFAVLLVVPPLGYDSPKEYEDAVATMDSIEGSWREMRDASDHNLAGRQVGDWHPQWSRGGGF
jgi:hypothetical protein